MKKPRKVWIDESHYDTWFVRYADRRYKQHHFAAQFYKPDHTQDEVKQWVIDNGFELIDRP